MIDVGSCKTCRYFDSKDWDSETKNWCRYNDLPAIYEGLCGHYELMIKPCPFCDNADDDMMSVFNDKDYIEKHGWYVYCHTCGAQGPRAGSEKDAIDKWNREVKK